uniref:Spondin-1 n=1 Tax=Corethrella appendiculata TaxID=1370023 RepID=U5EYT8_9DIPT
MSSLSFKTNKFSIIFGLIFVLVFNQSFKQILALRCDRTPEGSGAIKSPADGRFRIRISGNPDRYVPGEAYTISLAGVRSMQVPHKFSGFLLAAEVDTSTKPFQDPGLSQNVGAFQLFGDALTRFSERCPNVVTHTSSIPKSEIQVIWTAPQSGSGCVAIRATVIEHRDVWYMDDGPLSKVLCEDEADSVDTQPAVLKECCSCDEAKYELTFEGLWSRHTHPKDFPTNSWVTRFSDVIGASHTVDYRFWEYGSIASDGLKQVAEHGATRMLESELKNQSDKIRTIIKARGISYPNVTGKTFAVFRVDSNHHLVSIVSMIDPSPDWIVGVSGLELCQPDCSWIENKVLNLYPWDAGTDSGPTYESPDQPTYPQEAIRRIKSNYPNDPRSPFYDSSGSEMKPLARIYLSRQRLYEKKCESSGETGDQSEEKPECAVGNWGPWSSCSATCGKSKRHRQRQYLNPNIAHRNACKKKLTEREVCRLPPCFDSDMEQEENIPIDPECQVTDWSAWSECNKGCGKGVRQRSRKYKNKGVRKMCSARPNAPPLQETEECVEESACSGDITDMTQPLMGQRMNPRCKMTEWSEWTQCSVTCGLGRKMRTRMPIHGFGKNYDMRTHNERFFDHFTNRKRVSIEDDEDSNEDVDNSLRITDPNDPCVGVPMVEEVICGYDLPECGLYGVPEFCFLEPKVGTCRESHSRWYYDNDSGDCAILPFTGCGGNLNNFMSREDCLDTCSKNRKFDKIPIRDLTRSEENMKINCKVSHWKRGQCNVTCGAGSRIKTRIIEVHPKNGGNRCPRKLRKHEQCFVHCDSSRHDTNPSWGPSTNYKQEPIECIYSAWSAWSPCSRTCGDFAVQQRTRYVVNPEHTKYCPHRLEERKCDIMPCLLP